MKKHKVITGRFTAARKDQVLNDISKGILTEKEAEGLYGLSALELDHWKDKKEKMGIHGLKVRNCRAVA